MIIPALPFTLRQLQVFSSLAQTGSFRRCAEDLGISQASVSNQLKVLEDQLGIMLFDRKPGRKPLLTAEGRAFEGDLRQFYHAAQTLAAHKAGGEGSETAIKFRLLVGQGMFDFHIRQRLDEFFAEHPNIELDFDTLPPSTDMPKLVRAGRYDFGLMNLREGLAEQPDMQPLAMVRGGIYGHRSFAEGATLPLAPEAISELPFMLPPAGSTQERDVISSLAAEGIRPRKVVGHSQYYDVMAALLDRRVAVASFSETLLRPELRDHVIQLYPLTNWLMMLFRRPAPADPRRDAVERFLIESTVRNPGFPVAETYV